MISSIFARIKHAFEYVRSIFEAYGDESSRDTFKGELNYECGKLFFCVLLSMVCWLHYIPIELEMHPLPEFAVAIRLGLFFLCLSLVVLKFTKTFRNCPGRLILAMLLYMDIAMALVAATAGAAAAPYIGGMGVGFMVSIFAPVSFVMKAIYTTAALAVFFILGAALDVDFGAMPVRYNINDLFNAYIVTIIASMVVDNVKRKSWSRQQELKIASKMKSDFLAKMSHEIRTPMNAITGMSELALREEMSPVAHEHVLTIKQSSANLLAIINDILDLSKIESGKIEVVPVSYDLASLVNDVISIIRMRVANSTVRFVTNVDSRLPSGLFGDEIRVRQILLNILANAVKYTEDGFISLELKGEACDDGTLWLKAAVSDSGRGITAEDIDKLFDDFVRVDVIENRGVEGTGLGLSITKNLCIAMGGDISVQSEYGKGSTFTITLPQKIVSHRPFAVVERPECKSVLVYERRDIYADSLIRTIGNLGVRCSSVKDGKWLREELKTGEYNFVFVNSFLVDDVKNALEEFGVTARVALLSGFGDPVIDKDLNLIVMPAHALSVANVLNGVDDRYSRHAADVNAATQAKFCAPEARALVVDDIATNLKVAEGLLAPYKMAIDTALSGQQALQAVEKTEYDIIFMDHMMPGMDGMETTKRIRAMGGANEQIPIIALTANALSGARETFLQNGFDGFLSKPIDIAKLNAEMDKWIPMKKRAPVSVRIESDNSQPTLVASVASGADVKLGLALAGDGALDAYKSMLAVFVKDVRARIADIKLGADADDLTQYITCVHGLKSATANVGATELSAMAMALEDAGQRKDRAYIRENNQAFLNGLDALLAWADEVVAAHKENGSDATVGAKGVDREALRTALAALRAAIDDLDPAGIRAAVKKLKPFETAADVGDAVEGILQSVLNGEFDEAYAAAVELSDA